MNEIKVIKLVTGDELIGKVISTESNLLKVKNLIRLVPTQGGLQAVPFLIFGAKDQDVILKDEHVLVVGEPDQDIKNNYSQIFGEIVTPPVKLFVPE